MSNRDPHISHHPSKWGWFSGELLPAQSSDPAETWGPAVQPDPTAKGEHLGSPVQFASALLEGGHKSPGKAVPHGHSFLLMPMTSTVWSMHFCLFCCCPSRAQLDCTQQQSKS